ncbi:hypothetical protein BC629DRAFT_424612 [Irpex lacteus]|nr:hypothetical protein BC629DRAFT_424612 [Irpex lacteus]
MTSQPSASRVTSAPALPRGAACLPCRRGKMRCDGVRPVCGQCSSKGKADDCEYTGDVQGLTRIQLMEENIALLEARIRELEDPAQDLSVRLHSLVGPAAPEQVQLLPAIVPMEAPQAGHLQSANEHLPAPTVAEPTAPQVNSLIHAFIPHATQLGFFLNIPRFLQAIENTNLSNSPMAHPFGPLYDPLLGTVCLWGARLSSDEELRKYEDYLTGRSVGLLSSSILNTSRIAWTQEQAIIAIIQAEILLANYFFFMGRLLEGRYHCGAAAALCVSCRLNALTSPSQSLTHVPTGGIDTLVGLPGMTAPLDAVTLGERVNAFWTVYSLDTVWAIALGSASSLGESAGTAAANRPNMEILTPWPMRMVDCEEGHRVVFNSTDTPITTLLNDINYEFPTTSPLALRAQAATLFSHASKLASRYVNVISPAESNTFWNEFNRLDSLVARFIGSLPPVVNPNGNELDALEILVASTLARVAAIQLHHQFSGNRQAPSLRDTCVQHAQMVAAAVQTVGQQVRILDPIMAVMLTSVCQVFVSEISTQSSSGQAGSQEYITALTTSLDAVVHLLTELGTVCPLMNSQAKQIIEYQNR